MRGGGAGAGGPCALLPRLLSLHGAATLVPGAHLTHSHEDVLPTVWGRKEGERRGEDGEDLR